HGLGYYTAEVLCVRRQRKHFGFLHYGESFFALKRARKSRLFQYAFIGEPAPDLVSIVVAVGTSQDQMKIISITSDLRERARQDIQPFFEIEAAQTDDQSFPFQRGKFLPQTFP